MDILVAGFGPFPNVRVNPTTALAKDVARRLAFAGFEAQALVLETSYAGGLPVLSARLAATRPRAVLMLGLAARARFVRVELFGRGDASRLHPDATGATPGDAPRSRDALPLRATASPQAALATLLRSGIRARLSASAGRYLCDASYAVALEAARAGDQPVIFIHVPWLRPAPGRRPGRRVAAFRPGQSALAAALAAIGRTMARAGRRASS